MPKKNRINVIALRKTNDGEVLSFFTTNKRNHFTSESKVYDAIELNMRSVDTIFTVYLSTYPVIAVHVVCGNTQLLKAKQDSIEFAIQNALESQLRQT
jgi:hypothetical protein